LALSKKERDLINALVTNQMRLEQMIINQISPAAGLGYRVMRQDPFDSPLIISGEENRAISLAAASAGKKAGRSKRRKISAYQREFGRQLKRLKKKHPRTDISKLMKKAHIATRKARK
jgi:hypothetical protein